MNRHVVVLASLLCGAAWPVQQEHNTLTEAERAAGWRLLFDGRSTDGWRSFRSDTISAGWQVQDGALTRVGQGGDIVTRDLFENFELVLEWNVAPGGNSGIFYHVADMGGAVYETGPEMQVLDDARHDDGKSPLTSAGAVFGIYPTRRGVVKPAGEWNQARILVRGPHVEHWLNGRRVAVYELWSEDWKQRVKDSKFKQWQGYGLSSRGRIALQDHGDRVAYRDIKIRALP
jgi:hypothetical protein